MYFRSSCDKSRLDVITKQQMSGFVFGHDARRPERRRSSQSQGAQDERAAEAPVEPPFLTAAAHFASEGVHRRRCTSDLFPPGLVGVC